MKFQTQEFIAGKWYPMSVQYAGKRQSTFNSEAEAKEAVGTLRLKERIKQIK